MSYSRILDEIVKLEMNGQNLKTLKEMVVEFMVKEETLKSNKSNNTAKLQKLILAYLKKVDNVRPILQKVCMSDGKYWFTNGFSAIELKSELKIEGLPLVSENDGEYVKLDRIFLTDYVVVNEDIDKEILNSKVILYKAIEKETKRNKPLNKETCYKIENKYFDPTLLKEAFDIVGESIEIRTTNDLSISPIEIHGINGKALILPVRIKEE